MVLRSTAVVGWYFVAVVVALSTREDTALAVFVLGIVLLVLYRRSGDRRDRRVALITMALGVVWYVVCTQLVIPYFNDGRQPFYLEAFYGSYGGSFPEIAANIVRHPGHVVGDATHPDRLRFYRDLALPFGGLPLAGPLELLMAGPQMLASVIGASPYARMIRYQYTAVMIAPIVIAAIEGARWLWRYRIVQFLLVPGCSHGRAGPTSRGRRLRSVPGIRPGSLRTLGSRRFEQPSTRCPTRPLSQPPTHCCHILRTASTSTTGRIRSRRRIGATTIATGCRAR